MRFRKRLVVLKRFQSWFLINYLLYGLISFACVGAGTVIWIKLVAKEIFTLAGLISEPAMTLVKMNVQVGITITVALCASLVALSLLQAFIFSRKIAGPLFALNRHLERCERGGKFTKMKLRKGDLFSEIVETFNRAVDRANVDKELYREPNYVERKKVVGLKAFGRH